MRSKGYCKECGELVYQEDLNLGCSRCGHPNSESELWPLLPIYLIEYRVQNRIPLQKKRLGFKVFS